MLFYPRGVVDVLFSDRQGLNMKRKLIIVLIKKNKNESPTKVYGFTDDENSEVGEGFHCQDGRVRKTNDLLENV